jgi:dehydrogenase/reductase SDR family member 4
MEIFSLKGKVALITGASRGIGEAIARIFAEAGSKVVLSSRKQAVLDEIVADMTSKGYEAIGFAANAGKPTDLQTLVEKTVAHFGRLDIIVNNAAVNPVFGPLEQTDTAAFDKIIDVNLKGPHELAKAAKPHLEATGNGVILNISSIGGLSPEQYLGIYSVSKAALISLTKVQAREWASAGIRSNVICPGLIETQFSEALWSNEKILKMVLRKQALQRIGTPEEIAALALYLCSDASSFSTGAVFTADGGYTI